MAVSKISDTDITPGTSTSLDITNFAAGAGTDRAIVVLLGLRNVTGGTAATCDSLACSAGLTGTTSEIVEFIGTPDFNLYTTVSIWTIAAPSGTGTITATFNQNADYQCNVILFNGAHQTTPGSDATSSDTASGTPPTISLSIPNVGANDAAVIMGANLGGDSPNVTVGTETFADNTSNVNAAAGFRLGSGSLAVEWGAYTFGACAGIRIAAASEGAGPITEQEGYRWRNDDGSESTATWKAAQDTPATVQVSQNFRLRVLVNKR